MVKKIILILILLTSIKNFGQIENKDSYGKFLLFGILRLPYSIFPSYFDKENKHFDIFYEPEEILLDFIKKTAEKDSINDIKIEVTGKEFYLESKLLRKELPKYYPKNFYAPFLRLNHFKNDNQINSYITGAYLRDGKKINDTIYKIEVFLSEKPSYIFHLLKKINCSNVIYKDTGKVNPTMTTYFNPSAELKEYFNKFNDVPKNKERLKIHIENILKKDAFKLKTKRKRKKALELIPLRLNEFDKNVNQNNLREIDTVKKLLKKKKMSTHNNSKHNSF